MILVLDALMWWLEGKPGTLTGTFYAIVTMLYYILNPIICLCWYAYVEYYIHRSETRLKKALLPMAIPAAVNLVLSVTSLFGNVLFYIDSSNIYHRGKLFFVMAGISLFYLVYTLILAILRQKLIKKQDFLPIVFFMIPPVIGGILQVLFYGTSLIWPSVTFSILIIFIKIQNNQLFTDHLTGLFNRRQLDRYLQNKVLNIESGLLAGLMIDIDCFKSINDKYGHNSGDQALIDTAEILKKTFKKNDFIARFGGDEFVVVLSIQEISELQKAIDRLNANVALFNAQKTAPYTISLSIGYDCFFDHTENSAKDFIKHLDKLMYQNKQHSITD